MKSSSIIIKKSSGVGVGGRGARVAIPGVFPSAARFGEQVVKLRVPSLDAFIGGGIPIGSICVIRDEFPSKYGDMVLKSFIADGATYNHRLYIASSHPSPVTFSNELPSIKKSSSDSSKSPTDESGPDLKIAWRYGTQNPSGNPSGVTSPQSGGLSKASEHLSSFDFSKKVTAEELGCKNVHLSCISSSYSEGVAMPTCDPVSQGVQILQEIIQVCDDLDLESPKPPNNICRIAISHCDDEVLSGNFLWQLRSIVQHTNTCAVIVVSDTSCQKGMARARLEHLADIVISLQTIVDQKRRNELGGIDGVCSIIKLASNNTLKIVQPPKDIGFSFKKKRLLFHELHLPPEGENTTQRESSSSKASSALLSSGSCGTSLQAKRIDF